ncbi:MAG: hypothetical protein IPP46_18535 [Bacteroidetes bacterium]|nr:hypothetical protein [Bacteroidota bacterium]
MYLSEVTTPAHIQRFHAVPKGIYANDPHWVPYLRQDIEKLFDKEKNKLFREGAEAIRWILYDAQDKPIGRIAAFINPKTLDTSNFRTGGIGFFECIDDQNAANFLFDAAKKWLEERKLEAMDGPINFGDRNQFWGCQVTNWDEPPIYPMNYNPPYYAALFENYGFGIYFRQYMYWRSVEIPAQPIFHRKYNVLKNDPDFDLRNMRGMKLSEVAENFKEVYNAAWGGHSHFKDMSSSAAQKIFKAMKAAIDPDLIIFAFYKGQPIGFYISLPELNQIFRHVNGNLNLIGKLKFLYHKLRKTPNRMTGIIFGVSRAWHGRGVEAAMIVFGEKTIIPKGIYKDTVITWVGGFNPKMMKVAQNLDTTEWRKLHTYRYQFDRSKPFERAPIVE